MAQVAITKVDDQKKKELPVFEEIERRFKEVERRAFELFEGRGRQSGADLDDWLRAEREIMGWPAAELTKKDDGYAVQMTLPGFEAKDVEVTATPSEIIVHAATEETKKEEKGNVLWTEFESNDVYRRFEMPESINVEGVSAAIDNGILKIKAPQAQGQTTKQAAA